MKWIILVMMMCVTPVFSAEPPPVLSGSGASFPSLLFREMFKDYHRSVGEMISYRSIGSGNGLAELNEGKIDFAATDVPFTALDPKKKRFTYIPVTYGAVTVVYNLPGQLPIKLSPDIIADIFMGKITRWNSPRIHTLNPHISLPKLPIKVLTRQDESGTTFLFSGYLSKSHPQWRYKVGTDTKLTHVVGNKLVGNSAIATAVAETVGAISYTGWHHAIGHGLSIAAVQNASGRYMMPSIESMLHAAKEPVDLKKGNSLLFTNSPFGYPICGFSWVVLDRHQEGRSFADAKKLAQLVQWMTHQGQLLALENDYPPLPDWVIRSSRKTLKSLTHSGITLL